MEYGDWGLGIGDWGLGIGPNPQSPIPISPYLHKNFFKLFLKYLNNLILNNVSHKILLYQNISFFLQLITLFVC